MDATQKFLYSIRKKINGVVENREAANFLGNLGTVFVFRSVTAVLNIVIMVLAARYLGVVAVGDIVMIQNIAYLITIPIILGINTSVIKYYPIGGNEEGKFIGSVFICNLILNAAWVLVYTIFGKTFSNAANLSPDKWMLSVILALTINWSTILESILRAKKQFFRLGSIKLMGALVCFVIALLSCIAARSFYYFVLGLAVNQGIFSILALKNIKMGKPGFSLETSKFIYRYGAINMVSSGLSTLLFTIDLFIVNHFCSDYDVGIYSVYQVNAKNFFNIIFHDIFSTVFLPTIAQMDKVKIYKKIMSYIPFLLPLSILANAVLCMGVIFIYGRDYPFNWTYVLLVSTGTGLHFIYWLFNSAFIVEGKKGALLCLLVLGIPLPVLIAVCILFTKNFGITGTMFSWVVTQVTLIGVFILIIKYKYLNTVGKRIAEQETVI